MPVLANVAADFAADQARFSEPRDHHPPLTREEKLDSFFKALIEAIDQARDRVRFNLQDALAQWRARS